jgi:hypothetical protein
MKPAEKVQAKRKLDGISLKGCFHKGNQAKFGKGKSANQSQRKTQPKFVSFSDRNSYRYKRDSAIET